MPAESGISDTTSARGEWYADRDADPIAKLGPLLRPIKASMLLLKVLSS
jgi:hypothetical protein